MTRDDITRLAREAGLPAFLYPELIAETDWKLIERFAALVAAAEREACVRVCEENADDDTEGEWDSACISCANHIRARGQA
jgi:hypothetical protein